MKNFLVVLIGCFAFLQASAQETCSRLLLKGPAKTEPQDQRFFDVPHTPWSNHVPESVSNKQGFVKASTGLTGNKEQEMYYRIDYPKVRDNTKWVFLNHGLGDHSGRVNALASRYLADGYTVIRVDMLGHGRSLQKGLEGKYDFESPITIKDQALASKEVVMLAKQLGATGIELVGHSLGGANVLKLAALLRKPNYEKPDIKISSINLIGFYAQDLGDWHGAQVALGRPLTETVTQGIKFVAPESKEKIDRQFESGNFIFNQFVNATNAVFGFFGFQKVGETLASPQMERFMYNSFEPYFRYYAEKAGVDLKDPEAQKYLDIQVKSAIAVTRGARGFNIFHFAEDLPEPSIPIRIIAASKDELVPLAMMKQAALRFQDLGYRNVKIIEIEDAGHLSPRTHPDEVFAAIRN